MHKLFVAFFMVSLFSLFYKTSSELLQEFTIQVPGYSPTMKEEYISVIIPAKSGYIVKFEPFGDASRVHHMVLYGCEVPLYNTSIWKGVGTCHKGFVYIYGWSSAPGLELPKNVGFSIGHKNDKIKYIGLQVHYLNPIVGNVKDFSGITLHMTENRPKYLAGIYLFVKMNTTIPAKRSEFLVNISCEYKNELLLYPYAFRTHTHSMGRVVSAYVKQDQNWTLIGKSNPQWSQDVQPIHDPVIIHPGDILAATCRYDSTDKNEPVKLGSREVDEMCNFYMLYYADAESSLENPPICTEAASQNIMEQYPIEGTSLLSSQSGLEWEHQVNENDPFHKEISALKNVEFDSNDMISIIFISIVIFLSFSLIIVLVVFREKIIHDDYKYQLLE